MDYVVLNLAGEEVPLVTFQGLIPGDTVPSIIRAARIHDPAVLRLPVDRTLPTTWAGFVGPLGALEPPLGKYPNYLIIKVDQFFLLVAPFLAGVRNGSSELVTYNYVNGVWGQVFSSISGVGQAVNIFSAPASVNIAPANTAILTAELQSVGAYAIPILPYRIIAINPQANHMIYGATFRSPASGKPYLSDFPTIPTSNFPQGTSFPIRLGYRCLGITLPQDLTGSSRILLDGDIRIPSYLFERLSYSIGNKIFATLIRAFNPQGNYVFYEFTSTSGTTTLHENVDGQGFISYATVKLFVGDLTFYDRSEETFHVTIRDQRVMVVR